MRTTESQEPFYRPRTQKILVDFSIKKIYKYYDISNIGIILFLRTTQNKTVRISATCFDCRQQARNEYLRKQMLFAYIFCVNVLHTRHKKAWVRWNLLINNWGPRKTCRINKQIQKLTLVYICHQKHAKGHRECP